MNTYGATKLVDRRVFLKSAGGLFLAALSPGAAFAIGASDAVFASAYRSADGAYGVATLTEGGDIVHRYDLPARGHDVVWSPDTRFMVAFDRRPGVFAAVIDANSGAAPFVFYAPEGRHFYGHGVFSADGRLLYATENDFETPRSVIGIYDATDGFERIGELESHGLGPHDMELLSDGHTLVVANGGIETHPDYHRTKLNISTMQPNLSFIDVSTGDLKAHYKLPEHLHQLSIRHLTMLDDDTVWFACQNEGDQSQLVPLIGQVSFATGRFSTVDLPETVLASLRGYVGSIASNTITGQIAITSPRGHVAHIIDGESHALVDSRRMSDVCGVQSNKSTFSFSNGLGEFDGQVSNVGWDNHLSVRPG
ncbi:MAG: DUF1513 domain-containing protein [Hyphomicrobiales bacterium]